MNKTFYSLLLLISLNVFSLEIGGLKVVSIKGEPFEARLVLSNVNKLTEEDISITSSSIAFIKNKTMLDANNLYLELVENKPGIKILRITSASNTEESYYDFKISFDAEGLRERRYFGFLPLKKQKEINYEVVQRDSNDLSSCLDLTDPNLRLKCYDKSLSRKTEANTVVTQSSSQSNNQDYANDLFGKRGSLLRETIEKKDNVTLLDEVSSEISSVKRYDVDRYIIKLNNNQSWKILEPIKKNILSKGTKAVVSKGLFGTFNLVLDGKNKKYKVRRTK
ncbi:MAG: hypothetical protein CMD53_04595 [Gammaproteobacteria bacterium]|nr:hypothetical protein [Gammaproteobacteria bacterium]HJL95709.1 hypothetical protein [SAR86 cluster bacterium]|tara:strand:+ start:717 stop:1553 length:837 start_codon:yes stop_codon:yes gene_type:complete